MIWSFGMAIKEQPDTDGATTWKCLACGAEFTFPGPHTVQSMHYSLIDHVLTHMMRKQARDERTERKGEPST